MEEGSAPKRRLTIFGRAARRKRIFARLREGWAYDEIAREERLTAARVRQIVSEVLQKRQVDDGMDHALLQLARLGLYRIHTSRIRSALINGVARRAETRATPPDEGWPRRREIECPRPALSQCSDFAPLVSIVMKVPSQQ